MEHKFDFNDILIEPVVSSEINSRYNDIELPNTLPLFTAPMDTVVDLTNYYDFMKSGINVVLPRTISLNEYNAMSWSFTALKNAFISFGLKDIESLINGDIHIDKNSNILIDVANGHMEIIRDYARKIKELWPDMTIMVGNIANPETYCWYADADCVDYIRIGIGNGGGCLTTKQSGVGYPMASLIRETYLKKRIFIEEQEINKKFEYGIFSTKVIRRIPKIVADGGMKDYADVVKAFALGADYVMLGSIFNSSLESCADNYFHGIKITPNIAKYLFDHGYTVKKYFRGMSTKEAQKAMGKTSFKTSEGVVRYREVKYHLRTWVDNFTHYLRNAMSYSGAKNLDEFIGKANIIHISDHSYDRFNK